MADQLQALNDLQAVTRKSGGSMSPVVIREMLDRIASIGDESDRGTYWGFLGGQRDPQLVQPLIDIARQDPSERARFSAIEQLVADFPDDPAARAALESVAREDRSDANRQAAQRALQPGGP